MAVAGAAPLSALTKKAEALIAAVYLAGTNTRRVKRALFSLFEGAVSKDVVSRAWRKIKTDWEAWCARSLAGEDIVRLILDGTVVKARIDRKATAISVLVAIGVRRDGQKVLLAIRNMGGESRAAWRAFLDDLDARGLKAPAFVIVDGAPGLEAALAELWPDAPVQRCTVHKHRNLLAHAPKALHDELTEDYRDMVYAGDQGRDRAAPQGVPAQVAAEVQGGGRQPRGSRGSAVHFHPPRPVAVEVRPNDGCDRQDLLRIRWYPFLCAGDLVAKSGASAGSAAGQPTETLPGWRRPRAPRSLSPSGRLAGSGASASARLRGAGAGGRRRGRSATPALPAARSVPSAGADARPRRSARSPSRPARRRAPPGCGAP